MKEYAINFAFVAKGVIPSRISRISSAIVYVFYINVHVSRSNMCILSVCYEDGVPVKDKLRHWRVLFVFIFLLYMYKEFLTKDIFIMYVYKINCISERFSACVYR